MADAHGLQIAERGDDADDHFLDLVLLPESAGSLALAEHVLQVGPTVHVFAHHRDPKRVIHRLVEVVAEELQHVWMALNFKQLYSLLLFAHRNVTIGVKTRTESNDGNLKARHLPCTRSACQASWPRLP